MKTTPSLLTSIMILGTFSMLFAQAQAASSKSDPLETHYKIELIVFERLDDSAEDPEAWSKNIKLGYSPNWVRLVDANEEAERLIVQPQQGAPSGPEAGVEGAVLDNKATTPMHGPTTVEYLPYKENTLNNTAKALNRNRDKRVLFHRSWLQPLRPAKIAPALVIRGGNQFADHYELEGSITLHLSRYIHITTDLWLTQFAPNRGQQSDHWPQLPATPSELEDTPQKLTENLDLSEAMAALNAAETNKTADYPGRLPKSGETNSPNVEATNDYSAAISIEQQPSDNLRLDGLLEETPEEEIMDPTMDIINHPYIINQIVTLRQKRRMRSKELHYIDHPKIGLLIKVLPVEVEATIDETKTVSALY